MKYTEEQIQENRRKGVSLLRTTTVPQIEASFHNPETGGCCALGILGKAAGLELDATLWTTLTEAYGITYDGGPDSEIVIYEMNDNDPDDKDYKSFPEIGDYLAGVWGIA